MAITIENKREATKHITGLATFKVIAFNPNRKKLKELGIGKSEDEISYIDNTTVQQPQEDLSKKEVEVKRIKINIILQSVDAFVKEKYIENGKVMVRSIPNPMKDKYYQLQFFIENRVWSTIKDTGETDENNQPVYIFKQQFLNGVGRTTWATKLAAIQEQKNGEFFIKNKPVYPALKGLDMLYAFLQAWTNIDIFNETSKILLGENENDIQELFKKNDNKIIAELNELTKQLDQCYVKALVGVDGQYSKVFAKRVLSELSGKKDDERLFEEATAEHGFNADFQNSTSLQLYQPIMLEETPIQDNSANADEVKTIANDEVINTSTNKNIPDYDDLPF